MWVREPVEYSIRARSARASAPPHSRARRRQECPHRKKRGNADRWSCSGFGSGSFEQADAPPRPAALGSNGRGEEGEESHGEREAVEAGGGFEKVADLDGSPSVWGEEGRALGWGELERGAGGGELGVEVFLEKAE